MPRVRWSWSSRPRRTPAARSRRRMGDCAYGERRDPPGVRRRRPDARGEGAERRPTRAASRRPPSRSTWRPRARTCPAGQTTQDFKPSPTGGGQFRFAAAVCAACPLRAQCVRGVGGRTVAVHPQERLLQEARAFQASPAFAEYRRRRQMVEHRIARLVQLGIRQARYVGTRQDPVPTADGRRRGQPDLPRRHRHPAHQPEFGGPRGACRAPRAVRARS